MLAVVLVLVAAGAVATVARLPRQRRGSSLRDGRRAGRPVPGVDYAPGTGDDAEVPRDTPTRTIESLELPGEAAPDDARDLIDPAAGRMVRLRGRLARSNTAFGRGLLALLSRDVLDADAWEEVEDLLLTSDVGVKATETIVANLRTKVTVLGARTTDDVRELLRGELLALVGTTMPRELRLARHEGGQPAVALMVGVNGTGKTTTCGKLARLLVGEGSTVVLGAADTFRAAAADQLATWGERVGAEVVRGPEGADPASVAFEAVAAGKRSGADVVLVDTAGRLHTKAGLMDELGKVRRVIAKQGPIDEVLLVLDATTGQNGLLQARVFTEAVDVTGIVLTKLDGTAKGGIVVAVQQELGIPVKLVGLGEGPDDLAPFDPEVFVDALLAGPSAPEAA
ncbi:MAG: cell division protein FtsY [Mycobacterium sp.]|nr:cell division protein FtsY [Mycobacterium sp.]